MVALHKDVFREYAYVRDVLTPRVLELANDTRLTELLFNLDAAERQWSDCVYLAGPGQTQGTWQSFPVDAWEVVGDFHEAATTVAAHLAAIPDLPDPQALEILYVNDGEREYFRSRALPEQHRDYSQPRTRNLGGH